MSCRIEFCAKTRDVFVGKMPALSELYNMFLAYDVEGGQAKAEGIGNSKRILRGYEVCSQLCQRR